MHLRNHCSSLFCMVTVALALAACGDDTSGSSSSGTGDAATSTGAGTGTGTGTGTGSSSAGTDSSSSSSSDSSASSSSSGSGGAAPAAPEVVAAFDPAASELPEGLLIRETDALVGMALTGDIESVSLSNGERTVFGTVPGLPGDGTAFITGITLGLEGTIYVGLASFNEEVAAGIYMLTPEGGDAVLFASDPEMTFPNGLAYDPEDQLLYVADSAAGAIYVIDTNADVDLLVSDPILAGDPEACPGAPAGAPSVGANGLMLVNDNDELYVASSDQGALVKFNVNDGEAGPAELIAGPDCDLAGIDGFARDYNGTYVAAINRADKLIRIHVESGEIEPFVEGGLLDFPASVATEANGKLLVTSFALDAALAGETGAPALVRVSSF